MSERHVLTVGELKEYLNGSMLSDDAPVLVLENDAKMAGHDQFEGFKYCNVGGAVYNKYENETALIFGFSYSKKFKDICETKGVLSQNKIKETLIDIKEKELLKDEKR